MKFIDADAEDKKKEEKKKKEKKEQEKEGRDDKKEKKDKKKEKNVQPEVSKRPERKKNIPLIEVSSNLLLYDASLFQAMGLQHSVGTNFGSVSRAHGNPLVPGKIAIYKMATGRGEENLHQKCSHFIAGKLNADWKCLSKILLYSLCQNYINLDGK